MSQSRVTVVVPVYNVERYLERCLDSILGQTFTDLDVLIVNDASPDGSQDIIERYVAADPRVSYTIHEQNSGLGAARNTGIRLASADYIAFIDSDDYLEPDMIERLYEAITRHDADLAQCGIRKVNAAGETIGYSADKAGLLEGDDLHASAHAWWRQGAWLSWSAANKLYRRRLFLDHDIQYPPLFCEDVPVMAELIVRANRAVCIAECGYNYVIAGDTITRAVDIEKKLANVAQGLESIARADRAARDVLIDFPRSYIDSFRYQTRFYFTHGLRRDTPRLRYLLAMAVGECLTHRALLQRGDPHWILEFVKIAEDLDVSLLAALTETAVTNPRFRYLEALELLGRAYLHQRANAPAGSDGATPGLRALLGAMRGGLRRARRIARALRPSRRAE